MLALSHRKLYFRWIWIWLEKMVNGSVLICWTHMANPNNLKVNNSILFSHFLSPLKYILFKHQNLHQVTCTFKNCNVVGEPHTNVRFSFHTFRELHSLADISKTNFLFDKYFISFEKWSFAVGMWRQLSIET